MSKRDFILRYNFIIKKLRYSPATFDEINTYLKNEFDLIDGPKEISLRTFQRDLNEIRSIFNIDIKCNNYNQYYISEDDDPGFNQKMLEAFDIINSLNSGKSLAKYILLEKRCALGTEHIYGLLHAIRNRHLVEFTHKKFYENESTQRKCEPYALKEFKGRWYLLAKDSRDDMIKTFGLDRISELEILKNKFRQPENFSTTEYFNDCYGIIRPNDGKPEKIVLSFDLDQQKYIATYKLHESQKHLPEFTDEYRISLEVHITYDFIKELLSFGEAMAVIKPSSLKKAMIQHYTTALEIYE